MEALLAKERLRNKKWAFIKPPKRWTRDPIIAPKYKRKVKRKKAKRHVVKSHKRGGTSRIMEGKLPHGAHFVGGSLGTDSQQIFHGTKGTYYGTRMKPCNRRKIDFRGRLSLKSGKVIG